MVADSINYTKILPLAVESRSRRRGFLPDNGQRFVSDGNNIIRIPISASSLLDTKHSYLKMTIDNTTGQGVGLDFGGGSGLISRLRILQGGTTISDVLNYNKLVSAILLPAQTDTSKTATRSVTDAQRYLNSAGGGGPGGGLDVCLNAELSGAAPSTPTNDHDQIPNGTDCVICIPLVNGLLGSTQDKLVPLQLLNSSPLVIEITLAQALDIGTYTAAPAAGYSVHEVQYLASLVDVGPEVDQHLRQVQSLTGGRLILNGVDYTNYTGNVQAAATGLQTLDIPCRRKSIKDVLWVGCSNTFAGAALQEDRYNLSYGGHMNLREYSVKVGQTLYPPTAVDCDFVGANGQARSQAMEELAKCFGQVSSVHGQGVLNRFNYLATAGLNGGMPVESAGGASMASHKFGPFGLSLEAFGPDGKGARAIESGIDTATHSQPMSLQLNLFTAIGEVFNVQMYVVYDTLYYIDQVGNLRVSM